MYNVHFLPKFLREKYINIFNSFIYAYVLKSVILESNNDIHMQNSAPEYDNGFCF